jgi:hypothetical protein
MSIKILRKRAIKIIKNKGIKQISDSVFYVTEEGKEYRVQFKTLPGRTICICSCSNHAMHCRQPVICVHKLASCYYGMMNELKEEILKKKR